MTLHLFGQEDAVAERAGDLAVGAVVAEMMAIEQRGEGLVAAALDELVVELEVLGDGLRGHDLQALRAMGVLGRRECGAVLAVDVRVLAGERDALVALVTEEALEARALVHKQAALGQVDEALGALGEAGLGRFGWR